MWLIRSLVIMVVVVGLVQTDDQGNLDMASQMFHMMDTDQNGSLDS